MSGSQWRNTYYMNVVFHCVTSSFGRSLEQRSHIYVETTVGITCCNYFCTTVVSVLSHLGNHDTRTAAFLLCKFFGQFASSCEVCILFTFWWVHAWYSSDYCFITSYNCFTSIRNLAQGSTDMSCLYSQFQQIAFTCFYTFGDGCQSFVYFCLIAAFFQTLQIFNLFQTYSCIVYFKDIDRILFFQTIFVSADNCLGTGVDTGLSTCRSFFNTHFGYSGFDSFRHTAQAFNFLNMFPSLVSQFVS